MVGGTSFPPHDSKSEPWSNEQKTKATPKPSTKGKAKPEARTLAGRGIATGALEVSLDDADTVIEGGPHLSSAVSKGRQTGYPISRSLREVGFFLLVRKPALPLTTNPPDTQASAPACYSPA